MDIGEILRMVVGGIFVLFLPGLALSYAFFGRGAIDSIERAALAFALSIASVPLLAFYLNLIGLRLTIWAVLAETFAIIAIGLVVAWKRGNLESSYADPR